MRTVPALTGSLLIPLVYMIMLQLNYSQWTAALAGFLFLFGVKIIINQTVIWILRYLLVAFVNMFQTMPCWRNHTTCWWSLLFFSSPWVEYFVCWNFVLLSAVATPKPILILYVGGVGSFLVPSFWLVPYGKTREQTRNVDGVIFKQPFFSWIFFSYFPPTVSSTSEYTLTY